MDAAASEIEPRYLRARRRSLKARESAMVGGSVQTAACRRKKTLEILRSRDLPIFWLAGDDQATRLELREYALLQSGKLVIRQALAITIGRRID